MTRALKTTMTSAKVIYLIKAIQVLEYAWSRQREFLSAMVLLNDFSLFHDYSVQVMIQIISCSDARYVVHAHLPIRQPR